MLYQHMDANLPTWWHDNNFRISADPVYVRDRYHLSEVVYAPLLGRECKVTDPLSLSRWLRENKIWTLVIVGDAGMLHDRYINQDKEYQSLDTVLDANEAFWKLDPDLYDLILFTCPKAPYLDPKYVAERYLASR